MTSTTRLAIAGVLLWVAPAAAGNAADSHGTIEGTVTATPQKYLAETVVYLEKVSGSFADKTVELDQRNRTFVPHILTVTAGDTVKFLNSDSIDHNVYSPDCGYNLGVWGKGDVKTHRFTKTGVCTQLCSLHPEMLGYIFVGQNPFAAVVDDKGRYTIDDVPPGSYRIAVWNPKLKAAPEPVAVTAGKTSTANFSLSR